MRRILPFLLSICFAILLIGCVGAPEAYKTANKYRLQAVEPMLQTYSTDHPANQQKVSDLLRSWHAEVQEQQATTQPLPAPAAPIP